MKEFAVIGLGNFGATVARELSALDCRVTAIDIDKNRVQLLQDNVHMAIYADATERAFLENLEVDKFDCFIISTGEDSHAAILISLYLKELNAQRIIVKANSEDHAKILLKVGASETIIPEEQMAIRLSHSLAESNLIDYLPLTGDYCVAELAPPPRFVNKSLQELELRSNYHVQLVAVKDGQTREFNFAPGGQYRIRETDILVALGKREDIDKLRA